MKQINNHTANAIGKIHGTTFSVFLIANLIITALLDGELFPILQKVPNAWLVIIGAIIDATLYAVIYAIVKKLFDIALIKSNKKWTLREDGITYTYPVSLAKSITQRNG